MPKRIHAVFSGGVFKPVGAVDIPDDAEVELTVFDRAAFEAWWEEHAGRMRARTVGISPSEIERDVGAAFEEARSERRHGA